MTINPNNYIEARLTLVGYVSNPARTPAYDKENRGVLEISIPVNEGYKDKKSGEWVTTHTTWYNYSAVGQHADALAALRKGDKVRIDGAEQTVREYKTKDGETKLGISLRYGTLTVLESKEPAGDVPTPW